MVLVVRCDSLMLLSFVGMLCICLLRHGLFGQGMCFVQFVGL